MQNFFRQNRNILVVALSVFIVSMTGLMFFLNNEDLNHSELKTHVMNTHSAGAVDYEGEYRNLFESGNDPFVVMKLDGHMTFVSAQFEAATGFSSDDLKGRLFFSLIDGEDLPTFFSAFGKVIETGKPVTMIGPFGLADSRGDYRTSMGSVMPVMEGGRVARIGVLIKDISMEIEGKKNRTVTEEDEAAADPPPANPSLKKKPADPKSTNPANDLQKPKDIIDDGASWITGGRLVMNLPFRLPLFPAHLLLAGT